MALQCDVCFAPFDLETHCPKCLPCGHSLCKVCVENPALQKKCPTCRKKVAVALRNLPDNFALVRLIEAAGCKKPRREDSDEQRLQRGVDAGRKVVEALRLAVPKAVEALNRQLDAAVAQLRQLEEALEQQVQRGAAGDGRTSPEQLQLAVQLEDSLGLLTTKCSVVAEEEEEDGSIWKADVQPGGSGDIFRLLLLQLRADGQLVKVDGVSSSPAAYVGPPMTSTLFITGKDILEGDLKVNEILCDKRRWEDTRCLKGLRGKGSDQLLNIFASHKVPVQLEELECSGPVEPKVMEEVLQLTSLKRLDIESVQNCDDYPDLPLQLKELALQCPSERQLRCVQRMAGLQSLKACDYLGPNVPFTPSQSGTLRWLHVGLDSSHKPTMYSLIRAHASSLRELHVYCTIREDELDGDFYFPDLGRELAAVGLLQLRRLVLQRFNNNPCKDVAGCISQRCNLCSALPSKSLLVVCDPCATGLPAV